MMNYTTKALCHIVPIYSNRTVHVQNCTIVERIDNRLCRPFIEKHTMGEMSCVQ